MAEKKDAHGREHELREEARVVVGALDWRDNREGARATSRRHTRCPQCVLRVAAWRSVCVRCVRCVRSVRGARDKKLRAVRAVY